MSANAVNWITNVVAFLLGIAEPVLYFLSNEPWDWKRFIITLLSAIVAYFTGKTKVWSMKEEEKKKEDSVVE